MTEFTSAVFAVNGIAIVTGGAALTVGAGGVTPAVLTVAGHIVALTEDQVGVGIAVTVTPLARVTNHHWVAVVSGCTPGFLKE